MAEVAAPMSVDKLTQAISGGHVDTVMVAFTDLHGRLQGKRVDGEHFLDEVLAHGTQASVDLLAADVDPARSPGSGAATRRGGFSDLLLRPDLSTLRPATWQSGTAMVQCDLLWPDGTPVRPSPRQILMDQADRAADLGFVAYASTRPEFVVFDESYERAWAGAYRGLTSGSRYPGDNSLSGAGRAETLLREVRQHLNKAGMAVESARSARSPGQYELSFADADAITTADQHVVYKSAAKEIAARHTKALTFMAAFDAQTASSCHISLTLTGLGGDPVFAQSDASGRPGRSPIFSAFLAGMLVTMRDFTLMYAPNVNSYKRFQSDPAAPAAIAWGEDNRTCAIRVAGRGPSLRLENRVPGSDVNPYLALAAMLAGGLWGIEMDLPLEPALVGDAHDVERSRLPCTLREAREVFANSVLTRNAFGDDVVDHYVDTADAELAVFESTVTDWERLRCFERS